MTIGVIFERSPLKDLVQFRSGKSIKPGGKGVYPVHGSNGIIGASDDYLCEDAIIVGRVGAYCGSVVYCPTKFWASDNTIIVEPNPERIDTRFTYYLLIDANLNHHAGGAAQPLLTQSTLKPLEFNIPPLPTQRRIASILSTYDDLIENNTHRIAILEEMARRLYEEWFVNFRFPGHEGVRMVESELGDVPEGWEVCVLDNACSRITDGAHRSPQSVSDGKPMASVKDMHDWGLDLSQCRQISIEEFDELVRNNCKPQVGDILIAKDGANLNKHTFLIVEPLDVVLLSSIAIFRPTSDIDPEFLTAQLKAPSVSARIKRSVSGAAIPRIVLRDFKRLLIVVPPVEIQRNWRETGARFAEVCRLLVKKNTNLRTQRDLLLPKLISGEIDLSEVGEQQEVATA